MAGWWHSVWKLGFDSLDQPHQHVYFSQIGQEQSFLLVPRMRGLDIYEWMHKFVAEGVVNQPNLGINFVTCFVRPHVPSCYSICSWINLHHLENSVSYPMIPNVTCSNEMSRMSKIVTPLERRCINLSNGVTIMEISHTQPKLLDAEGRKFSNGEKRIWSSRSHKHTVENIVDPKSVVLLLLLHLMHSK